MDLRRQTNRRLHEEHLAVIDLLARFERAIVAAAGASEAQRPAFQRLARELAHGLDFEVAAHFDFEEHELFPRLADAGERDLVAILEEEHVVVRDVAATVRAELARVLAGSLDDAGWRALRTHGLELCERLTSHAQKEEGALLPALEALLDDEADREAFAAYTAA